MKRETVALTPAQADFLRETVPWFNSRKCNITCAGCAGSDRRFVRVTSARPKKSVVLVVWNSADNDWDRFIAIQRDLSPFVPFLPRIFAYDDRHGLILEEDLGDETLMRFCGRADPSSAITAYRSALNALSAWQRVDPSSCSVISGRNMDKEMFLWESWYFAEHCVKEYFGLDVMLTSAWEHERGHIASEAAGFSKVCIHRDFQSENILLKRGAVRLVDFQGSRRGPAGYDVASLLFDPYVSILTPLLSSTLFAHYQLIAPVNVSAHSFRICAIQRLMQALGAYGNLSIHKGKQWYRTFVPVALERLRGVAVGRPSFPVLLGIVDACLDACKKSTLC